jgi:hypothetical protein
VGSSSPTAFSPAQIRGVDRVSTQRSRSRHDRVDRSAPGTKPTAIAASLATCTPSALPLASSALCRSPAPVECTLADWEDGAAKRTRLLSRVISSDGHLMDSDDFSDYRDVGGLRIAYKRPVRTDDRPSTLELTTVEVNPEIDLAVFDKPATKRHDASP